MKAFSIGILFLIVATFVSIAPAATAACNFTPVGGVCTYDDTFAYGDDCEYDGIRQSITGVEVFTIGSGAYVVGYTFCDTWIPACYEYDASLIAAGAYGPVGGAEVGWTSYEFASPCYGNFSGCSTYVLVYSVTYLYEDLGCPAGSPPNPGWGGLLP